MCRLGSLSAAAAELGYTQSAVSRQIAGLERQLGVSLVQRHARGVRPTPAGEVFRHQAHLAVNEADRAVRAARDARDGALSRPLAVGATPSLAAGIVPTAIRRLLDRAGPLQWSLLPGLSAQLHDRVIAGDLDVAVVTDAPPGLPHDPRNERRFLGMDEMSSSCPPTIHEPGTGRYAFRNWPTRPGSRTTTARQHCCTSTPPAPEPPPASTSLRPICPARWPWSQPATPLPSCPEY